MGSNPGEAVLGAAGTPPFSNDVRSPGSEICCGRGTPRNGICGKFSCAWGSNPAGPLAGAAAGTVGVNPGMPVIPGVVVAGAVGVSPGIPSPGVELVAAGATPVKEPQEVFWGGYSSYVADPDGYLWEIAYNPFTDLT